MDINILTVCFGGELEMTKGYCEYVGEIVSKAFVIQNEIELDSLKQMISDRFDICLETNELELSHLHPLQKLKAPFTINKNEDLKAFMSINEAPQVAWSLPLHVAAKKKVNESEIITIVQQTSVDTVSDEYAQESVDGLLALTAVVASEDTEPDNDEDQNEDLSDHEKDTVDFIYVGQIFNSKTELKTTVANMAVKEKFQFRVKKSTHTRYKVICIDASCKWTVVATCVKNSSYFEIRRVNEEHTCPYSVRCREHRKPSYQAVADKIKIRYEGVTKGPDLTQIRNTMQKEFMQDVSYWKAWRAKGMAQDLIRGTPEENYKMLPSYLYMIQKVNPGTYTCIEMDTCNHFKYAFLSFGASIRGFHMMRKVIMLDTAFLHGKFRGILITATAQDADRHVYPLAFGVADSENDNAWKWFLEKLSNVIPDTHELVFESDQHVSISKAVEAVYKSAKHVICTRHLKQDIKARYKQRGVLHFVTNASECYTIKEFEGYFRSICAVNNEIGNYLQDADFQKWSRAHFQGDRYNLMTTNNAECINEILKEARGYPIVALFEHIRNKMADWFNDRREKAAEITDLPSTVKDILQKRDNHSGRYEVNVLNDTQCNVVGGNFTGVVDLAQKTCSCRVFDLDHIPCVHAIVAIQRMKLNITDFVSEYYKIQALYMAYQEIIYPVPCQDNWNVPEDVKQMKCRPPIVCKKSGRPRKCRISSVGEGQQKKRNVTYKCGICGNKSHNKMTCPDKASSSAQNQEEQNQEEQHQEEQHQEECL